MTNQKKWRKAGAWLVPSIVIGAALGVMLGNLVWWLAGTFVRGLIAGMARLRNHAADEKKGLYDDVP